MIRVHQKTDLTTLTDALSAILELTETGGTITTDGNEQTVYINNAPDGIYLPVGIFFDFTNQTGAETVDIRTYYRLSSGGDLIELTETSYAGVQDPLLVYIPLYANRYGIKVTIEKTGGANKAYIWEAVYKI